MRRAATGICTALAAALTPFVTAAGEFVSPAAGGGGGQAYDLACGPDAVLTGVSGKWGAWLDSFGITCRKINADGSLGGAFTRPRVGGSDGDTVGNADCPADQVVNSTWFATGSYVNEVSIVCGHWSAADRTVAAPSIEDTKDGAIGQDQMFTNFSRVACPTDGKPAKGFRGKEGAYVDSIALVCNDVVLSTPGGSAPLLPGSAPAPGGSALAGIPQNPKTSALKEARAAAPGAGPTFTTFPSKPVNLPSTGGDVTIVASGADPLSVTLQVPPAHASKFELVTPPIRKSAATSGRTATVTRIVRFKGVPPAKGPAAIRAPVQIPVTLTLTDGQNRTTTRTFTVKGG